SRTTCFSRRRPRPWFSLSSRFSAAAAAELVVRLARFLAIGGVPPDEAFGVDLALPLPGPPWLGHRWCTKPEPRPSCRARLPSAGQRSHLQPGVRSDLWDAAPGWPLGRRPPLRGRPLAVPSPGPRAPRGEAARPGHLYRTLLRRSLRPLRLAATGATGSRGGA